METPVLALFQVLLVFIGSLVTRRGTFGGRTRDSCTLLVLLFKRQCLLQNIVIDAFVMYKQVRLFTYYQVTERFGKACIFGDLGCRVKNSFNASKKKRFRGCFVKVTLGSGWFGCIILLFGFLFRIVALSNWSTIYDEQIQLSQRVQYSAKVARNKKRSCRLLNSNNLHSLNIKDIGRKYIMNRRSRRERSGTKGQTKSDKSSRRCRPFEGYHYR